MPKISIESRTGWKNVNPEHKLPQGLLADTPDTDGEYPTTVEGNTIIVEMHPPEATRPELVVVALTCGVFEGHERNTGYVGNERHVIYINGKKRAGSTSLSVYDKVVVKLQKP